MKRTAFLLTVGACVVILGTFSARADDGQKQEDEIRLLRANNNLLKSSIEKLRAEVAILKAENARLRALAEKANIYPEELQAPQPHSAPVQSTSLPAVDPLASPEALLATLVKDVPHNPKEDPAWEDMTTLMRNEAMEEYQRKLTERKTTDWRGKTVTWLLTVRDVSKAERGDGFVLTAASGSGYLVTTVLPSRFKDILVSLKKDDLVSVAGTIQDYRIGGPVRSRRMFDPAMGQPFGVMLAGENITNSTDCVYFYGLTATAYHIVYVVDRSGSMLDTFDGVREEIIRSVGRLSQERTFHVIFFASGKPKENPPLRLVYATPETKRELLEFLKPIGAEGKADPVPAIERAFATLSRTPGDKKGKLIYFLTDGDFPDNEKALKAIRNMNIKRDVRINTILHHNRSPGVMKVLEQIAKENGGVFKFVGSNE